MASLKVGDRIPDITLPSATGENIRLRDFEGEKAVVVYFYPKDDTPGCTKESCAFRDNYSMFTEVGAEVIGISSDSEKSHQEFASKYDLPFTLLSDTNQKARKAFGVPNALFVLPGRVTYVIDKQGIVKHIYDSMLDFNAHVQESLQVIQAL